MTVPTTQRRTKSRVLGVSSALLVLLVASTTYSQELSEPVYRTPAKQVSASPSVSALPATATGPAAISDEEFFDLERKEGDHPLAPCLRMANRSLKHLETNINDYSCDFAKQERIDGRLTAAQHMHMRAMVEPFSVYMMFRKPKKGQECLYVDGANDGRMKARAHGWKGAMTGVLNLDVNGSLAMADQKYPITKAGIRNLTLELIKIAENDIKYGECTVQNYPDVKVGKRPAVMVEVTHPVPRNEFRFHLARIYLDREHRIPVRFEAYSWPKTTGGKPVLEEVYMFTNIKLNNGYDSAYFAESNPDFFK